MADTPGRVPASTRALVSIGAGWQTHVLQEIRRALVLVVCSLMAASVGLNLLDASDRALAELIDSEAGLAARPLDGAPDEDDASVVNVQLKALVSLLTDALEAEGLD